MYRWLSFAVLHSAAVLVGGARVYLGYHSLLQVAVGALVGALAGAAWFACTESLLLPLFPRIADWRLCRLLYIRDTTHVRNVLREEYLALRAAERAGREDAERRRHKQQ